MPDETNAVEVTDAPELSASPSGASADSSTDMPDLSGFEELGLGAGLPGTESAPAAGSPDPSSNTSKPSGAAGPNERPSNNTKGPRAGAA